MRIPTIARWAAAAAVLVSYLALAATPAAARIIANPDPTDPSGGQPPTAPDWSKPPAGFTWKATDRYYQWGAAWSELGEPTTWPNETYWEGYVNPTSWPIVVQGCQTLSDFHHDYFAPETWKKLQAEDPDSFPDPQYRYRWQYNGKTQAFSTDCWGHLSFPAEGIYYVTLTVRAPDGTETSWTHPVEVKDFLVVVLGDSSASGEGAPDLPYHDGVPRAEWIDNRCHRSNYAGGAQAAERIEASDSKSSVTFLSFACSGATLATEIYNGGLPDPYEDETDHEFRGVGITAPYSGIEPYRYSTTGTVDFSNKVPSQVEQLWDALTDGGTHPPRKIDALIVAGGINDARFADLAVICVLFAECDAEWVGETPGIQRTLDEQFLYDVARVPGGWDALGDDLATPRQVLGAGYHTMQADVKLALQYPSFFHDDDGDMCDEVLDDTLPWFLQPLYPFSGWDQTEIWWANEYWATDLDTAVRTGSERNGFTFVDTINGRFQRHGMCADDNWINTPPESASNQGDDTGEGGALASLFSKGTAHPNVEGYAAYAEEILRHLNHLTKKDGNNAPQPYQDKVTAGKGLTSTFNVLENDIDADVMDVLAARLQTEPLHGTVTMKKDGTATYKPRAGFLGNDSFYYEVTDGNAIRYGLVSITVINPVKVSATVVGGVVLDVGGLLGAYSLEPPFNVVFDKPLRPEQGDLDVDGDEIYFDPPPLRRRRIRLPYTVRSMTENITSPSYGESVRGILVLRVRPPR